MDGAGYALDDLDLALLTALAERPRIGDMELSRVVQVARATVQSRIRRLTEAGVITGWGPAIDPEAAGFPVRAFVTLHISQGALDEVARDLTAIPHVLEAHVTTGEFDVLCQIATPSHRDLQATLVRIDQSAAVVRSVSVMVLSTLIPRRVLPLLASAPRERTGRAPAYRR
jgi:DNA-binding Lrp family transcriptional regulator